MVIKQILVDKEKYSLKCPYEMIPKGIVVHNTNNTASAINEIRYMIRNSLQTSFHFAVDDIQIIQGLPLNRNGWHASDGKSGKGNRETIAIEICYSTDYKTDRYLKAEENTIDLIVKLCKDYNLTIDDIKPHQFYATNKKFCPHRILERLNGWNEFIGKIEKKLKGSVVNQTDEVFEKAKKYNSPRCKELQEKLNLCGYDCGKPDNVYGVKTHSALGLFQSKNNLVLDYLAGNTTFAKLDELIAIKNKPQEPKYQVENCVCYCNEIDKRAAQYLSDFLNCECIDARIPKNWNGYAKNLYAVGGDNPKKTKGECGFSGYTTRVIRGNDRYETIQNVLNFIKQ